jgi:RNA polymerase sigma-70 factor (ECF subfamily)
MSGELLTSPIPEGWGALTNALRGAVRSICPAWLQAQADDLAQEAVLKLWRMGLLGEGKGGVSTSYLWRVAHSVLVDEIRRRRRRHEVSMETEAGVLERATDQPEPERQASGVEAGRAILDCLRRLQAAQRRASLLHLLEHSVPEIARLLSWPPKKAENAVYRGLAGLRRCLAEKGWEP